MDNKVREAAKSLEIKCFKLTNGDSVLGIIKKESHTSIVIEGPLAIEESYVDNKYRYGLKHWFEFNPNDTATIMKSNLVAFSDINIGVKTSYLSVIISDGIDEINAIENTNGMTCH